MLVLCPAVQFREQISRFVDPNASAQMGHVFVKKRRTADHCVINQRNVDDNASCANVNAFAIPNFILNEEPEEVSNV
jgi:hypothetical protein